MNSTNSHLLSKEQVAKHLKTLGFNPVTLQHAFLELSLPNLSIVDVSEVASFTNVMYLDVSLNQIESLSSLSALPCLVQLNASKNSINKMLDFAPVHCRFGDAWPDGHHAAGSMLTHVNLSHNRISTMVDSSRHQFIECLMLSQNQITQIAGLSELKFLKTLDLSHNHLTEISGLDGLPIRELNVSGNQLRSLRGLNKLSNLTTLLAADNPVESLSPLAGCDSLSYIDVSDNALLHVRQTEFLREIPWLHVLLMHGCPCFRKEHYRLRVLYRLPHLRRLDLTNVSEEEKIRALNLYQCEGGDLQLRAQVHGKYIFDEPFEDHSPVQFACGTDDEDGISIQSLANGGREWNEAEAAHRVATNYFESVLRAVL